MLFFTGGQGAIVFSNAGRAATLPYDAHSYYPNCSITDWMFRRYSSNKETVFKIVSDGQVIPESPKAERLRLLPNCSLYITDVTIEDVGLYYGIHQKETGFSSYVYLFVLSSKWNTTETFI